MRWPGIEPGTPTGEVPTSQRLHGRRFNGPAPVALGTAWIRGGSRARARPFFKGPGACPETVGPGSIAGITLQARPLPRGSAVQGSAVPARYCASATPIAGAVLTLHYMSPIGLASARLEPCDLALARSRSHVGQRLARCARGALGSPLDYGGPPRWRGGDPVGLLGHSATSRPQHRGR